MKTTPFEMVFIIREDMNRLSAEKSPYLLQHATNPVDWYPWGEEAFARAKSEDKPIFLSIGYSTCHWCHVMARESFADAEVAELLNQKFISIKLDREERPDVDAVYMAACQALTGAGGWPLTVIMTPEQKPFWVGTYLPRDARYGHIGLMELLDSVAYQWGSSRERLLRTGNEITDFLQSRHTTGSKDGPQKELIHRAVDSLGKVFDRRRGGFGSAPKFPIPHNYLFLLQYSALEKGELAREMTERSLTQMFRGGIFDHIGGGFSRYSTDERWLAPHFEKMLYDNALLVLAYLEAYRLTKRPLYRRVVTRTLDYVLRELTDPLGGFYCGQDADSEGVEGKYYVFTPEEIHTVLGEEGGRFCERFDITEKGNFEGRSIPNLLSCLDFETEEPWLSAAFEKLYVYRLSRTSLHRDDKVLCSWNGLMLAAMAKAGRLLNEEKYLQAAKKAQGFIQDNMLDETGGLWLRWREGEAAHKGQLDDYAFYAFGLLTLYETTLEVFYLREAVRLAQRMKEQFFDSQNGGFYIYSRDGERLISRPKEVYDGALPSGNSVAALVLLQLFSLTGEPAWQEAGERQLRFLAGAMQNYPAGYSMAQLALMRALYPSAELVIASAAPEAPEALFNLLVEKAPPHLAVLLKTRENAQALAELAPFTAEFRLPQSQSVFYLCRNGACSSPVEGLTELEKLIKIYE